MLIDVFAYAIALPATLALALFAVAWRARSHERVAAAIGAVAVAGAYGLSHLVLLGAPALGPRASIELLAYFALAAAVLGAVDAAARGPGWARLAWRAGAASILTWLVASRASSTGEGLAWAATGTVGTLALWYGLEHVATRGGTRLGWLALAAVAAATAAVGPLSDVVTLGLASAGLATATAAGLAGALATRGRLDPRGAIAAGSLLLPPIWLIEVRFAELHVGALALLALAPALYAAVRAVATERLGRGARALRALALAVPVLAAVALSAYRYVDTAQAPADEYGYGYD